MEVPANQFSVEDTLAVAIVCVCVCVVKMFVVNTFIYLGWFTSAHVSMRQIASNGDMAGSKYDFCN